MKGLGGLIGRPIKGTFDLFAQPVVGCIRTPEYIYSSVCVKEPQQPVNFKLFGIKSEFMHSE